MKFVHEGLALSLIGATTLVAAATPTSPLIGQAKRTVAAEVLDPGSLQWRNLRTIHATVQGKALTVACGEYNARNKLGGYVGFAKFAYEPTVLQGVVALKADGDLEMFGDATPDRTEAGNVPKASILAACLGIKI